jgi:hypothetical protein
MLLMIEETEITPRVTPTSEDYPEVSFWSVTFLARSVLWDMSHKPVSGSRDERMLL